MLAFVPEKVGEPRKSGLDAPLLTYRLPLVLTMVCTSADGARHDVGLCPAEIP